MQGEVDLFALCSEAGGHIRGRALLFIRHVSDRDAGALRAGAEQVLFGQQLGQHHVTQAEAHARLRTAADRGQQVVVAAASKDGAQLACRVKGLKDNAGVVRQAPYHRDVEHDRVGHAVGRQPGQAGVQFVQSCRFPRAQKGAYFIQGGDLEQPENSGLHLA